MIELYHPKRFIKYLRNNVFSINVIILNSTQCQLGPIKNKTLFKLYNTGIRYSKDNKTIILSYEDEQHFRLVGHLQNNNMITLFNNTTLPNEMFNIIDEDLIKH